MWPWQAVDDDVATLFLVLNEMIKFDFPLIGVGSLIIIWSANRVKIVFLHRLILLNHLLVHLEIVLVDWCIWVEYLTHAPDEKSIDSTSS